MTKAHDEYIKLEKKLAKLREEEKNIQWLMLVPWFEMTDEEREFIEQIRSN